MTETRKKRLRQLAGWTWSWVATLALATFGPKFIWDHHAVLTPLVIMLNLVHGIMMIIANRNLFNDFDELEKKIHLESMAMTLGLTVIVGLSYSLLDITNLIEGNAEIGFLVFFIGISYLLCLLWNKKRYA